jgi:hypothetical protein
MRALSAELNARFDFSAPEGQKTLRGRIRRLQSKPNLSNHLRGWFFVLA